MTSHLTYAREVTARGFLGALRQRGLEIVHEPGQAQVALLAYTARGSSAAARLEVPTSELRRLARMLLEVADATEGAPGLRHATVSLSQLAGRRPSLRRAG